MSVYPTSTRRSARRPHAMARRPKAREESWSGMCPAGKHGLDFEGQNCDVCAHDAGRPCGRSCRRCATKSHATIASSPELEVGDIVQRSDINSRNRYVIVNIQGPWIYTRRISGSGGPGVVTFPTRFMLRKV